MATQDAIGRLAGARGASGPAGAEGSSGSAGAEGSSGPAGAEGASGPAEVPGAAESDERLARFAKAMGHPVRAGIIRVLASQETCQYGDLSDRVPLAKSTVSQHLKILREAGLVRVEEEGSRVCYCIDVEGLARLKALVEGIGGK